MFNVRPHLLQLQMLVRVGGVHGSNLIILGVPQLETIQGGHGSDENHRTIETMWSKIDWLRKEAQFNADKSKGLQ